MQAAANHIEVKNVSKAFGRFTALQNVSFEAKRGEFLSILGPSGCGKTTLLRILAGLERQDEGFVIIAGSDVSHIPVSGRRVGIVFQSYALFPNLTAEENIAYGLRRGFRKGKAVRDRAQEMIRLVGLDGLAGKYPAQLSGGEQQRVALARAIAGSPAFLLLDEPLSALDATVRARLRSEVRLLQQSLGVTTLMVTHDQEEALAMADRILVMNRGRLLQAGTPGEIYDSPVDPFVASFIGTMNFIHDAVREAPCVYRKGPLRLIVGEDRRAEQSSRAILAIRPEDVLLHRGDQTSGKENTVFALVQRMEYRGASYRVLVRVSPEDGSLPAFEVNVPAEKIKRLKIREDMQVQLDFPINRIKVYAA